MSWFRIDDKFHSHAKVLQAGNAAVGLYTRCGAWSCDQRTEGKIPRHVARSFGTPKEIRTLLSCALWAETEDGYVMPDFLDFNPSNAEVDAKRQARAEAGAKGGQRSGETRRSKGEANASALLDVCFDSGEANTNPHPIPSPTPSLVTNSVVISESLSADDDDAFASRVVNEIARLRCKGNATINAKGYQQKTVTNFREHEMDDLRAFLAERPEAEQDNEWERAARIFETYRIERAS